MTDTASAAPSEREQFEAWAKSHGTLLTKDKRGNYQYTPTSAMWKAWQAARSQPTPPAVVEPLEPVVTDVHGINERIHFRPGWRPAEAAHGIGIKKGAQDGTL